MPTVKKYLWLPLLFLLAQCAVEPTMTLSPPAKDYDPIVLKLFIAPPCVPCTKEVRYLHTNIPKEFAEIAEKFLTIIAYVETGTKFTQKPSDEVTAQYRAALGVDFTFVTDGPDTPGKYPTYPEPKKYFNVTIPRLPAAVILNQAGEVLFENEPGQANGEIRIMEFLSNYFS